jgi:hypothetical protein
VEMITQRPVMGSLRRSGIADYFTRNLVSPSKCPRTPSLF